MLLRGASVVSMSGAHSVGLGTSSGSLVPSGMITAVGLSNLQFRGHELLSQPLRAWIFHVLRSHAAQLPGLQPGRH